jgi:hypothetical protein
MLEIVKLELPALVSVHGRDHAFITKAARENGDLVIDASDTVFSLLHPALSDDFTSWKQYYGYVCSLL